MCIWTSGYAQLNFLCFSLCLYKRTATRTAAIEFTSMYGSASICTLFTLQRLSHKYRLNWDSEIYYHWYGIYIHSILACSFYLFRSQFSRCVYFNCYLSKGSRTLCIYKVHTYGEVYDHRCCFENSFFFSLLLPSRSFLSSSCNFFSNLIQKSI